MIRHITILGIPMIALRHSVLLVAAALSVSGCSKRIAAPTMVPADGRVFRSDGKPLPTVKIEFVPLPFGDMTSETWLPFALVEGAGRFTARGPVDTPNLIKAGKYKVTVKGFLPKDRASLPAIYADPRTTPFEIDVTGAEILLEIK